MLQREEMKNICENIYNALELGTRYNHNSDRKLKSWPHRWHWPSDSTNLRLGDSISHDLGFGLNFAAKGQRRKIYTNAFDKRLVEIRQLTSWGNLKAVNPGIRTPAEFKKGIYLGEYCGSIVPIGWNDEPGRRDENYTCH